MSSKKMKSLTLSNDTRFIFTRVATMDALHREFIEFAMAQGALKFGVFTLKSGRTSPYFFNMGLFQTGEALARLTEFYAAVIARSPELSQCNGIFGPAYKGIPLVSGTAIALYRKHGIDMPYSFNRKEAKDHGEGGTIVGAALKGRILIIDDVITAGTAINEAIGILKAAGASPAGVIVALDRQEITGGVDVPQDHTRPLSAIQQVELANQIPVVSIVKLDHLVAYLRETGARPEDLAAMEAYRAMYGAK